MTITIELYPETPRPDWVKIGAICMCLGEGYDLYRIVQLRSNAAVLETLNGDCHGWESFSKLHSPQEKES